MQYVDAIIPCHYDVGASWHARNVMSWYHDVAYFCVLMSHSLLVPIGVIAYHDSLHGDQAAVSLFETMTFSS